MNENIRNSYGLYDAPIRFAGKEYVRLTQEDIERQIEAGAFPMEREKAIEAGFINPQEEPDTVIVDIRRDGA